MRVAARLGFNGLDYLHAAAAARKGMRKKRREIAPGIVVTEPVPPPPPGLPIAVPEEAVEMKPRKRRKDVFEDDQSMF